jgi:hypothetical protein
MRTGCTASTRWHSHKFLQPLTFNQKPRLHIIPHRQLITEDRLAGTQTRMYATHIQYTQTLLRAALASLVMTTCVSEARESVDNSHSIQSHQ